MSDRNRWDTDRIIDNLTEEIRDLRDIIKLLIGQQTLVPWRMVPESEVDEYVQEIRRLKGER